MAKPNGIVLYEGPSELDGEQIVVIITGLKRTNNRKTGTMLQSWIMLQDTPPCDAANQNLDGSICGNCKHRTWGTCYVNLGHSPYNVYKAYKRGSYPNINDVEIDIKDRTLRIGSYGDPAAVPQDVWQAIVSSIKGVTGYTHQWKKSNLHLANYCMASVDSIAEARRAKALGFRTFRIILEGEELLKDEYHCPADKNVGGHTTCDICLGCDGLLRGKRKNPVIVLHGSSFKVKRYKRIMELRNCKRSFKHLLPSRG